MSLQSGIESEMQLQLQLQTADAAAGNVTVLDVSKPPISASELHLRVMSDE